MPNPKTLANEFSDERLISGLSLVWASSALDWAVFFTGEFNLSPAGIQQELLAVTEDLRLRVQLWGETLRDRIERNVTAEEPEQQKEQLIALASAFLVGQGTVIVATEVKNAAEALSFAALQRSNHTHKMWLSRRDRVVRRDHRELDGTTIPLGEKFNVRGRSAMRPGGFGDPALDANCRCVLVPPTSPAQQGETWQRLNTRLARWERQAQSALTAGFQSALSSALAKF